MPLRTPPPQIPVVTYSDPNKGDRGLIEFWNTELAVYTPLDIGSPHPNTREFPGFTLGLQNPVENDEKWIRRVWVSPETNPDWFNYQIKYSAESNLHPIFIRTYREAKIGYTPRAKASALGTVYKLIVVDSGNGYTPGTFPNLTFSTGNAVGHAVINQDGTISEFVLDDGGDSYTVAPTFIVDAPPVGTTATGTAQIQPVSAVLVKEEAQQFPAESEYYGQYFQVIRIYETLPGPQLTTVQFTERGIQETVTTQRIISGTLSPIVTSTVTEKSAAEDTVVDLFTHTEDAKFWEGKSFGIEIPDPIPVRFRVVAPTTTLEVILEGTASLPTLGTGDLSIEERQVTEQLFHRTTVTRAGTVLPVTLISYKMTREKQIETVTETLDSGLQTLGAINELTVEAEVQNLGNNTSLLTMGTVSDLFRNPSAETSIRDILPPEFRGVFPEYTFSENIAGNITEPPVLLPGDLDVKEDQLDEFTFRRSRTTLAPTTLPITLTSNEWTEQWGGVMLNVNATLDSSVLGATQGFYIVESRAKALGNGLYLLLTKEVSNPPGYPGLTSFDWDEEMQVRFERFEQIMPYNYVPVDGTNFTETTRAIDKWRSRRIRITKVPTATSEATAIVNQIFAPFQFPGTADVNQLVITNCFYGFRSVRAEFVKQTVKTWWINSITMPVIPFDEIITDSITVSGSSRIRELHGVLHDAYANSVAYYPATTPTFTEYYYGIPDGTSTDHNFITIYTPGSGYNVGDTITIPSDSGPSAQIQVISLGLSGSIGSYQIILEGTGGTFTNPVSVTGGSGIGAEFNVTPYTIPNFIPGTKWVGTERTVLANISHTEIKNQWKIQIREIVMR